MRLRIAFLTLYKHGQHFKGMSGFKVLACPVFFKAMVKLFGKLSGLKEANVFVHILSILLTVGIFLQVCYTQKYEYWADEFPAYSPVQI